MEPVPTKEELKKFKVVELKEKLGKLGLPINGLKADLIDRLHTYLVTQQQQQDEDDNEEEHETMEFSGSEEQPGQAATPPSHVTAIEHHASQPTSPPFSQSPQQMQSLPPPPPQNVAPTQHMPPAPQQLPLPPQQVPPHPQQLPPPQQTVPPPQQIHPPPQQLQPPPQQIPPPQQLPPPPQQLPPPPQQLPPPPQQLPPPPQQQLAPPPQHMPPPPPQQIGQPGPTSAQHLPPPPPQQIQATAPSQHLPPPPPQQMTPPTQMMQPGVHRAPLPAQVEVPPHLGHPPRGAPQMMQTMHPPQPASQEPAPPGVQSQPQVQQMPPQPPHEGGSNLDTDPDFQRKVAIQQQLLGAEQQKQQQQKLMEQQKEAMALAQQAILISQRQSQPVGPPPANVGDDLMEKVRQQQAMLEMEKQKQFFEQEQKIKQQQQAISQAEQERRMKEAELLRQQQIALMEAQKEAQEKHMQEQQVPPPVPMQLGGPLPGAVRPPQISTQPPGIAPPGMPTPSQAPTLGPPPPGSIPPQRPPTSVPGMMMPQPPGVMPPGQPPQQTLPPPGPPVRPQMPQGPPSGPQNPIPTPGPPPERIRPPGPPEQERLPPPQLDMPAQPVQKEIKLPQALEKVLAFKDVRAQEVGVTPEELEKMNAPLERDDNDEESEDVGYGTFDMEEEEEPQKSSADQKESKNKKRKKKKKKAKRNRLLQQQQQQQKAQETAPIEDSNIHVDYIQEQLELDPTDPNYFTFAKIFEAFKISEEKPKEDRTEKKEEVKPVAPTKLKIDEDIDDDDDDDFDDMPEKKDDDDQPKLSKKKLKKMTRLSVAQLKQLVFRPDVVEMHDVTAQDPRLLVHLKATRNTVPVPRHWCFKRKYLQGKRGIEKPPFELPDYIKATGIMEMREALAEKEDQKTLKAKMREKVRPKMGKIDIDYQKLHDAFFRWQTKPKMTIHGDLYYEGKEFETRLKEKKPGNLSDELRTALGMPLGHNADKFPPPWLIAMQRYGPPPSYPNLKIPGLSAPIPEGCSFGYHAGGWGKPPVDENGKPLYGDVFGTQSGEFQAPVQEEEIDKTLWGEMEEESSSEEESEEEDEEEEDTSGLITPGPEGLVTPSGITSVPMGMETPEMIELRKKRIEDAMDQGGETPALYTVLPEKKSAVGSAMMGSAHIYDTSAVTAVVGGVGKKPEKTGTEVIEVALNPEELDLDTAAMQAKYDQTMREQQSQLEKEDLSDMVAEHAAKQKKRKKQQQDTGKSAKKYKEFKF